MPRRDVSLERIRRICLALPDTKETLTWGSPHFRVGDKIFAGWGEEGEGPRLGFKLERAHAEAVLDDPRFVRAPYVGRYGWVSMDVSGVRDWEEVRGFLHESYGLIAPASSRAKLEAGRAGKPAAKAAKSAKRIPKRSTGTTRRR